MRITNVEGRAVEAENVERDELDEEKEVKDAQDDIIKRIPPWYRQITIRSLIASAIIGAVYCVVVMKLGLTTGYSPNFNVSAALLGFVFIKSWTKLLEASGYVATPFTPQENTVIQTCAVATYSVAVGGGFGSYLLGMNRKTYEQSGTDIPANNPGSIVEPGISWMIGFYLASTFVGLFALIPLRKVMILGYKLSYPTGTATAVLINGLFNDKKGDKLAKKQVRGFAKYFSFSFFWAFFQWFFTGNENCGFVTFPTFGLKAYANSFYFDFSLTYIGAGMICPHNVNLSLLFGAILSYGIMWPLIGELQGDWFSASIPKSSMKSLSGYKVFVSIALIIGDGLYNFLKIAFLVISSMLAKKKVNLENCSISQKEDLNDPLRNEVFMREKIPMWVAGVGYCIFSILAIIVVPIMFHQIKWYHVLVAYLIAPILSFCNAYGAGLTDQNMAYNYGKVALFVLASLGGTENGVIAGLVACGLIKSIVDISADLMQDLKTGHMTLTSPRSMIVSQAIGTALGCVIAPVTFYLFYKAFDVGNPDGIYKAPYGLVYRNMAIVGVEGFSALPQHCLQLCYGFFAFAIVANLVKDLSPKKIGKWIPLPMAMAIPFLVGAYFAIDMCLGSLIVFVWHKLNKAKANLMTPIVASGLMCGDGLWILPASVLALAGVKPPICMTFLPTK